MDTPLFFVCEEVEGHRAFGVYSKLKAAPARAPFKLGTVCLSHAAAVTHAEALGKQNAAECYAVKGAKYSFELEDTWVA